MVWHVFAWRWLAHSAITGLIVLAAGSVAVALCRQPVRRGRLVVFTVLGGLIGPWLGTVPLVPRWQVQVSRIRPADAPALPAMATTPETSDHARVRPAPVASNSSSARSMVRRVAAASPRVVRRNWPRLALAAYALVTAGLLARWLLGQVLLWRMYRAARPAPAALRATFLALSGPAGKCVRLRVSDRIGLPFTFTWTRPVIIVPAALGEGDDPDAMRYGLAHEWSHVEQHDAWAWNLCCLAGCVLFYQPLFWWLQKQLRLSQDYLADDRAAACGSPEDYAALLLRLARSCSTPSHLPALGISGQGSQLSRRIVMLVQDRQPLERRCRTRWSLAVAATVAALVVTVSGLRLDASDLPSAPLDKPAAAVTPAAVPNADAGRTWTGRVLDKETGQPIAEADVLVQVSISRDKTTNDPRELREVRQKTDAEGRYRFSVTPDEAAERLLYITLEVEEANHVRYFGGYSYGMILKNETLGERPFYEKLELAPGKAIEGRLMSPEREPVAGVKVQAFSTPDADRPFEDGRWAETWTDANGHFRLILHSKGQAVFWLLPNDYEPSTHGLKNDRRGDLGTITLDRGIRFSGRILDAQGKPVGGVYLSAGRESRPEGNDDVPRGVADLIHRSVLTAADGTFTIGPFPPGKYRVQPDEKGWDPVTRVGAKDPERRPLPAVFTPLTVILKEGETVEPVEIRAAPHVVVEAQIYDSKGQKRSGHDVWFSGRIDGGFWSANPHPSGDGKFVILAPHGLEDAMMSLTTNEHSCLQFRLSKDQPLSHSRTIRLGTLDHDIKGIEIIRYEAPIILIKATTKDGQPFKGVRVAVDYTGPNKNRDGKYILKGGMKSDVNLEAMGDGQFRTSQLAPDREVTVVAQAQGYASKSETLSLPEGATREVQLILDKE